MMRKKLNLVFSLMLVALAVCAWSAPCYSATFGAGPDIGEGDSLEAFTTTDLRGNKVDLADYIGRKVILLDFWSIYCAPCVEGLPSLIDLYNKYNDMGLEVFAISLDSHFNARRLTKFVEGFQYQIPYPIIHDSASEIRRLYGVGTLPTTIIVDREGRVRLIHIGFKPEDKKILVESVMRLLAQEDGLSSP